MTSYRVVLVLVLVLALPSLVGCDVVVLGDDPAKDGCPTEFGTQRLLVVTNQKSWHEAQAACRDLGPNSHLAVISSAEYTEVLGMIPTQTGGGNAYAWLGLTDIRTEGVFRWITAEQALAPGMLWASDQPNGGIGMPDQDCVIIGAPTGTTEDRVCTELYYFACECSTFDVDEDSFSESQ